MDSLRQINLSTIEIIDASITGLEVEAIVNAANPTLAGGGGVDGAIHRAAGPELRSSCLSFPELRPGVRCEAGQVKVTAGFALHARHVIHTVGPVWYGGGRGERDLLAACYRNALFEVARLQLSSVAFPAIGTGAYGYPAHEAAKVAAHEAVVFAEASPSAIRIVFSCFGVTMVNHLKRAVDFELGQKTAR